MTADAAVAADSAVTSDAAVPDGAGEADAAPGEDASVAADAATVDMAVVDAATSTDASPADVAEQDTAPATDARACTVPQCLIDLVTPCAASGSCTAQVTLDVVGTNVCFENGVKQRTQLVLPAPNPATTSAVTTVKKAGGDVCYTLETATITAAGTSSFTWKDPGGTVVATGSVAPGGKMKVTCMGGTEVEIDGEGCPRTGTESTTSCTLGTCAF
jgi:hypothetical protein